MIYDAEMELTGVRQPGAPASLWDGQGQADVEVGYVLSSDSDDSKPGKTVGLEKPSLGNDNYVLRKT
jgi:hypothetical protein